MNTTFPTIIIRNQTTHIMFLYLVPSTRVPVSKSPMICLNASMKKFVCSSDASSSPSYSETTCIMTVNAATTMKKKMRNSWRSLATFMSIWTRKLSLTNMRMRKHSFRKDWIITRHRSARSHDSESGSPRGSERYINR
jgi:hypothetical protein